MVETFRFIFVTGEQDITQMKGKMFKREFSFTFKRKTLILVACEPRRSYQEVIKHEDEYNNCCDFSFAFVPKRDFIHQYATGAKLETFFTFHVRIPVFDNQPAISPMALAPPRSKLFKIVDKKT